MIRKRTTKTIAVTLIGLLIFAVGVVDASRHNGGGSGRGGHGYSGHRGHARGGSYRGPNRGGRRGEYRHHRGARSGSRRGIHRGRPVVRHRRAVRHGYRNHPGKRYHGKRYHAPRYRHYRRYPYRRHVCRPGVRCYHARWRPRYRYYSPGYAWVRPAVGSIVVGLPLGCAGFYIGGSLHYYYNDVYYRPVPTGYMVVAPPAAPPPPVAAGEAVYTRVSVVAALLNVRSGPGPNYGILQQVRKGEMMDVTGEKNGWLSVVTPGGQTGWVDARYTAPILDGGG